MPHGEIINAEKASDLIKNYESIIEKLKPKLDQVAKSITGTKDVESKNFLQEVIKKKNCFIFDKNLVKRFFNTKEEVTHFLVFLGAKDDGGGMPGVRGDLTVILAGCRYDATKDEYYSLNELKNIEASQHPSNESMVFPKTHLVGSVFTPSVETIKVIM